MTKDEAIEWAGGTVALAEKLGITHGAVSQWSAVPMVHQYRIERMSRGQLVVDKDERDKTGAK